MVKTCRHRHLLGAFLALFGCAALGQNATTPGAITTPYPTIENISVEWAIGGDADADGVVFVRYRRLGTGNWLDNMPLRRVPGGNNVGFSWGNKHSGSVFDLEPDTTYEIELQLVDPDGGNSTQVVTERTRPVPTPMAGAPVTTVTPQTLGDALDALSPGDILELAPGSYGDITIRDSGLPGQPIVLRGQPGVIINGEIRVVEEAHIMLDQLTVNGRILFNRTDNFSVTRCTITAIAGGNFDGHGIVDFGRAENSYIADNVIIGTTIWRESAFGAQGDNEGEGIRLSGPGHVIMNNRVSGFRDNISFSEDGGATDQFSIDVLNNEVSEAADDGIEADFCLHNCRIMRNRVTNSFIAFSSQPGLGGPTYFIRNSAYNVAFLAFKLLRNSVGDVLLHNTVVKVGDALGIRSGSATIGRLYTRNNLMIGGPGGRFNGFNAGSGEVIRITSLITATADMDYDALGSTTGEFSGRFGGSIRFDDLDELQTDTTEAHAGQVDLSVFQNTVAFPADPAAIYDFHVLSIAAGSTAEDMGEPLANINDGFSGSGPDAGAYERNVPIPEYGPRGTVTEPPEGLIFSNGFE